MAIYYDKQIVVIGVKEKGEWNVRWGIAADKR